MHNRVSAFVHVTTQGWKSLEQGVGTITVHSQSPAFSPFATERQRQCAASNHLERVRALVNRQQPLQQDSQVHAGVARRGHALTLRPGSTHEQQSTCAAAWCSGSHSPSAAHCVTTCKGLLA